MSRAVMQQALKALEKCRDWPGAYDECSRALHNLRAALAEPETDTDCHAQGICQRSGYSIAPTPRRPLTPEQLTKIELGLRVYADNDRYDLSLHDFARAIERAHGITGREQT